MASLDGATKDAREERVVASPIANNKRRAAIPSRQHWPPLECVTANETSKICLQTTNTLMRWEHP